MKLGKQTWKGHTYHMPVEADVFNWEWQRASLACTGPGYNCTVAKAKERKTESGDDQQKK
jgi:hypothetical protein